VQVWAKLFPDGTDADGDHELMALVPRNVPADGMARYLNYYLQTISRTNIPHRGRKRGAMADINEVFDQLVLHYNTDTLLGNLAQALKRQAERDNDKRRKNVIRAEAKVVEELADQITAGEIPWPGESDFKRIRSRGFNSSQTRPRVSTEAVHRNHCPAEDRRGLW